MDFERPTMESLIEQASRQDPSCKEVEIPDDRNDVTDDRLIRLVEALKRNPHIRKIDLRGARCTPELFLELAALLRVNTAIQHVRLPGGMSSDELSLITESLCDNTTVTTLYLCWCIWFMQGRHCGEVVRSLLLSNGTIREINLHCNPSLGADGAAGLAQALRNERCVLKKLDLGGCSIGNDGARELSTALGINIILEELNIGDNEITFTGFFHIVEMLETNSVLQVLDLGSNHLNQDRTSPRTVGELLSRVFQRNASLRELNFDWCKDILAAELHGMVEGLRNNKTLVCIRTWYEDRWRDRDQELWCMWSRFVTCSNKMRPLLEGNTLEEAPGGLPVQPVPQGLWPYLLKWCTDRRRYYWTEAEASLIHHVLCARSSDICEWVTMTAARRRAPAG